LSPDYDINPTVDRQELTLAINEVETTCHVSIAMEAAQDYGLNAREAAEVLKQVRDAVGDWKEEATRLNIPRAEQDLMANAFPAGYITSADVRLSGVAETFKNRRLGASLGRSHMFSIRCSE
jgi:hypothetical protein